ncbi:MAG: FMN-binding protein [Bacteroidetes bacterium]|nr:FMN-binding protein [Bacteroidota bacterium]
MRSVLILFLVFFATNLIASPPEISKKFIKELEKHYKTDKIETQEINELSSSSDRYFKVFNGDQYLGIVVLTSARGRYDKFDYMLIYNLNLEIELIKILVYRSDYGSEITAKRWLSQFYKKGDDSLKYGSDIQAISGATFSAMSLTKNVNRINKNLKEYFAK